MEWCPHCQKNIEPWEVSFFEELKILACPVCHIGLSVDVPKDEDLINAIQQRRAARENKKPAR